VFTYAGGKYRRRLHLCDRLERRGAATEYREPFLGSGGLTWEFLARNPGIRRVWLNDRNPALVAFWRAAILHPAELSGALFRIGRGDLPALYGSAARLLASLADPPTDRAGLVEAGRAWMVCQMMRFHGYATSSPRPRPNRWNPHYYLSRMERVGRVLRGRIVRLTCGDFGPLLADNRGVVFADPPYWMLDLYPGRFSVSDHLRLRDMLRQRGSWVLTYDDCPVVRLMYDWAEIETVPVRYRYRSRLARRTELVITPEQ